MSLTNDPTNESGVEMELNEMKEKYNKVRIELTALRAKESQENRFIWWMWNVYLKNIEDMIYGILEATTYETEQDAEKGRYGLPIKCFDLMRQVSEYTEGIRGGTYIDSSVLNVKKSEKK